MNAPLLPLVDGAPECTDCNDTGYIKDVAIDSAKLITTATHAYCPSCQRGQRLIEMRRLNDFIAQSSKLRVVDGMPPKRQQIDAATTWLRHVLKGVDRAEPEAIERAISLHERCHPLQAARAAGGDF